MDSYTCSHPTCLNEAALECLHEDQPPINLCHEHFNLHISRGESLKVVVLTPKIQEKNTQVIEKYFSISEKELKLTIETAIKASLEIINQVKAELSSIIDRSSEIKNVNKGLFKRLMDYSLGQSNIELSPSCKEIFKVPDIENYLKNNSIFHYYSINTMVSQFEEKWKSKLKSELNSPARSNPEETSTNDLSAKYNSLKKKYFQEQNRLKSKESAYFEEKKRNEAKIEENVKTIKSLQAEIEDLRNTNNEIFEDYSNINRIKDEEFKSELHFIKEKLKELVMRNWRSEDLAAKIERVFIKAINHQSIENKNLEQKIEDNKGNKKNTDMRMQEKKAKEIIDGPIIPMKRSKPHEEEQKHQSIPKKGEKHQVREDTSNWLNDLPGIIPKKHPKH